MSDKTDSKKGHWLFLLFLCLSLFISGKNYSQGTSCATATSLTVNGACGGAVTISDNSQDTPNASGCSMATFRREGWYTFTVAGGPLNVTITAIAADRDLFLQLISSTSSCTGLADIGCANANTTAGNQTETITTTLNNGIYYVKVINNGNNNNMSLTSICVTGTASPCNSATNIAACGTTVNTTIAAGTGSYSPSACGFTTGGIEKVFTFTPAVTGVYQIEQASSFAYIDYQYRTVASGCGSSGWTCIDDMSGTINSPGFTLTAGVPYYFLLDAESTAGGNVSFSIGCPIVAPTNDDCTGAIALTINPTCTFSTYTTAGATATTSPATPPAPGCSSYTGGDVWFSFVVPANGEVTIDTQTAVMTDGGMAWYTGACGSLTLLECDDDDSANGMMPLITRTGLTPGATIYVRVWEYGNDNPGTFGICASSPPACTTPTTQPTALVLTPSGGNISGTFTAASPIPSNYLVVYNTTGATPSPVNTTSYSIGGTVGAGNIVADNDTNTAFSVAGLSSNTTYYFFVFSFNNSACAGGPLYLTVSPLTGNATTGLAYCNPASTSSTDYISNFTTTGGINNIAVTSSSMSTGGYGDYYSTQTASHVVGGTINFTETYNSGSHGFNVWVDWNNDGDFVDGGEKVFASGATASSHSGNFVVPAVAVGNYRMRIRAWYGTNNPDPCTSITYGEAKDFKFSVLTPLACAGNPTNITVSAITATTATTSWTAASPAPGSGYQYFLSTTNAAPSGVTGSTGAGVVTTGLTGLTGETTYYVWVRSNCGGANQGYWIGPIMFKTPCLPGTSTGTSSLGCPSVISGGLALNGADPTPVDCTSASSCVDLEATFLQLGQTTNYTVQSIPYSPPYQFSCLQNPVSVNVDDVWSSAIALPFNFCYYGNNYNTCTIGSNGILSFDMTKAGTSSGYSYSNNLPSTTGALFGNSIYGVYHDIDPSKGGEVGWELITLNTGCRALVASWSNVPMFSNNSILYSGMMVLYENTNIIEVYIKEKNVDGTWNGGNAIVGLQNAAGTQAVVAPGRNGLDTDWTVANEAWRFVPSGPSITTIKWYEGSGTAGPLVGTTNTINVCPATTTTYTAEVTYALCNGTTLIETDETVVSVSGNKIWNGSVSTNWNVANNWTPSGVPTALDCVVIPNVANDPVVSGAGFNALARTLTVQNGGLLTINSGSNATVTNIVRVLAGGQFLVKNGANLVQIDNVTNVGSITMERDTNIRSLDYVYWSSPVASFPVTSVSPGTPGAYIYKWLPTTATAYASNFGNWSNTGENMVVGKGYIVRGPSSYTSALQNYTATFSGVPNNGTLTTPISRSTYNGANYTGPTSTLVTKEDDNWNLVGNPYPSSIHAINFLTLNTNIAGFIKVWTHGTLPASAVVDPFYTDYAYNYTPGDYITYNSAGTSSGPGVFGGFVGAGQSFFVNMNHTSAATTETVTFNNTLRSSTYNNSQFFRTTNVDNNTDSDIERNRIWLDIITTDRANMRTLVGYIEGATNENDRLFDAITDEKLNLNIYSNLDTQKLNIQGRSLPFNNNDLVPMGIIVPSAGNYSIAIAALDGLFSNTSQNIFLEDKALNVIHNLRQAPYNFTTTEGITDNRFVLRYTDNSLSNNDYDYSDELKIFANNHLNVISTAVSIKDIIVYDVLGKTLAERKDVDQKEVVLNEIKPTTNVLIVKVILENNAVVTKKVVY